MSKANVLATLLNDLPIEDIKTELELILKSPDFERSPRIREFLRYVVEETIENRSEYLKGYSIALAVFGRDEAFDPSSDPLVRVQGVRLRRMLEQYYLTQGKSDPIRIMLPKGKYVPAFYQQQLDRVETASVPAQQTVEPIESGNIPIVAVLPFDNLNHSPDLDYFSDGLSEEIISGLSRFKEFAVLSRHTSFEYRGKQFDIRKLHSELGANYLLEGSVRQAGNQIRVTARLLETAQGAGLWNDTFDRELTVENIFNLQSEISDQVVAAIAVPYGVIQRTKQANLTTSTACSLNAYELVLRFYQYWSGASELHDEIRLGLENCLKTDGNYSCAWAALAFVYLDEYRLQINPQPDAEPPLDRAMHAASKAVELNSDCPMAYQALFCTHFHRHEIDEFLSTGERALQLNPNHADMLADLGLDLYLIGDRERGLALAEKAIRLSPIHPGWYHLARCMHLFWTKNYSQTLKELKKFNMPQIYGYHLLMAGACAHLGRQEEARNAVNSLTENHAAFVANPRFELRKWNIDEDLIDLLLEGLCLAGKKPERAEYRTTECAE